MSTHDPTNNDLISILADVLEDLIDAVETGVRNSLNRQRSVNREHLSELTPAEAVAEQAANEVERGLTLGAALRTMADLAGRASDEAYRDAKAAGASGPDLQAAGIAPTTLRDHIEKPPKVRPPRAHHIDEIAKAWGAARQRGSRA